jgi:hypothetical protein
MPGRFNDSMIASAQMAGWLRNGEWGMGRIKPERFDTQSGCYFEFTLILSIDGPVLTAENETARRAGGPESRNGYRLGKGGDRLWRQMVPSPVDYLGRTVMIKVLGSILLRANFHPPAIVHRLSNPIALE